MTATAKRPKPHAHDECPKCRGRIELRLGANRCPWCEHTWQAIMPQSGPQTLFLSERLAGVDIVGFGGAAGGGKSWALLLDPIPDMGVKGFQAVIFRRDATQITNAGGLWDASREIYPFVGAKPRETPALQWRFPSGGRISFHHLHSPDDQYAWQGAEICDLEFDELTHFEEDQFWYLISRNRSTCGVRPRTRATFNPDASSWVKLLFAPWVDDDYPDPAGTGEVRYLVRQDGYHYFQREAEARAYAREVFVELTAEDAEHSVKSVTFVPARLGDNPALMDRNPQYRANLLALSPVERARLLYGDWNILSDRFFEQWRVTTAEGTPWHVIPTDEVPKGRTYYLGVDWGFSDPFACYLLAVAHDGRPMVCREVYERGRLTSEQGELMLAMLADAGLPKNTLVYAGHDVFNRRLRSSGAYDEPIVLTWQKMGLSVISAGRDPLNRASKTREYLRDWGLDEGWPDGRPGLQVMECCPNLIRTLPLLQSDPLHPEQVDTTQEDHGYDAVGHLLTSLPRRPGPPGPDPLTFDPRSLTRLRAEAEREQRQERVAAGAYRADYPDLEV